MRGAPVMSERIARSNEFLRSSGKVSGCERMCFSHTVSQVTVNTNLREEAKADLNRRRLTNMVVLYSRSSAD